MINSLQLQDYEVGLLGLILVDENIFHIIKGQINNDDFENDKHKIIFKAISKIYDKGFEKIEITPIVHQLKIENNLKKIGGHEYLVFLMEQPALKDNVNTYIKIISEYAHLRNVTKKIDNFINEWNKWNTNNQNKTVNDILEKWEKTEIEILESIRGKNIKEFVDSKTAVDITIKKIEERAIGKGVSGIAVDFPKLDKITGGFQNGDLIIIAARPSMGKTAFALNIATNASLKKNVAFFSLEMPFQQLYNRIIGFTAYVDQNKLRESKYLNKNEWNKIYFARKKIEKMNLFIDDTAVIRLSELVWKAKKLHKNKKLDIIFIDYLQLIITSNSIKENRQNEVSLISRTLKKLARDLNIPIVALSQLSRRVEQRENKIPIMSDLRESGAIEQDSDIVAFLYRESYYNKNKNEINESSDREITDIILSKHRNGAIGTIKLFFKPNNGLFIEKEN